MSGIIVQSHRTLRGLSFRYQGHFAGLRIYDIRDALFPKEIGAFVPPSPGKMLDPRPGYLPAPMSCDINVQPDGVMYLSDWNGGLNVLQYEG